MTVALVLVTVALVAAVIFIFRLIAAVRSEKLRAHRHFNARVDISERARRDLTRVTHVAFQAIGTSDPDSWKQALGNVLLVTKEALEAHGMSPQEWEDVLGSTPAPPRVRRRFPQAPTTAAIAAGFETPTASVSGMAAQAQEEWTEGVEQTAVEFEAASGETVEFTSSATLADDANPSADAVADHARAAALEAEGLDPEGEA